MSWANCFPFYAFVGEEVFAKLPPTTVLPPIPTAHLTAADVEELTRTTRETMLKELVALTASPMGQKATRAKVGAGEEDLARLAMASGSER